MTNPADGWTGVDVDGAGIDMFPVPAESLMKNIATLVSEIRTQWESTNGTILALESKLGDGPLGRPVAERYNPTAKQLRSFITDMLARTQKLSDAGVRAVPIYVTADNLAGQHFEF
ncbi:hypothetical protein [Actinophytocola sediminis]